MRLISIDVGIKNLAFCHFHRVEPDQPWNIVQWDVVNLAEKETHLCQKQPCSQPAKFEKQGGYFCLKHAKKQSFHIPTSDLNPSHLKKQKLIQLIEIAEKNNIEYDKPPKKQNLIHSIEEYIRTSCFQALQETHAADVDLVFIGRMIKLKLNDVLQLEPGEKIDYVIIENQISPIANRMKTVQGMIAQYFIMKENGFADHIEFISACNKLKDYEDTTDTTTYTDRKKGGILKTRELLEEQYNNNNNKSWLSFFEKHKKKDDLADSFLQGLWYMRHRLK